MPIDRAEVLKKAEKLLRTGKLDLAIAEYVRLVEQQPRDWNTRNTLGDLYVRASKTNDAVAQYMQIADHLFNEGFYPKASALYKKILKIRPDDESVQMHLAEISAKQGLLADAKGYFVAIAAKRRARGDGAGADEITVRLGALDPADFDARALGARTLAQRGDLVAAAMQYRSMHVDLLDKGRAAEAMAALREAVRLNPEDLEGRAELAKAAVAASDLDTARLFLDRATAGSDPALMFPLLEIELRSGRLDASRELLTELLHADPSLRARIVDLAWTLAPVSLRCGVRLHRHRGQRRARGRQLHGCRRHAAGVHHARVGTDRGAAQARGDLRRRWARSDDVRDAGAAGRRLSRARPGSRGACHRRGSRRARAVGARAYRSLPPRADTARRARPRRPHCRSPERPGPVRGDGSVHGAGVVRGPERADPSPSRRRHAGAPPCRNRKCPRSPSPSPNASPRRRCRPCTNRRCRRLRAANPGPDIDLNDVLSQLGTARADAPVTVHQDLDEVFDARRAAASRHAGVQEATKQLALAKNYAEMGMVDEAMVALTQGGEDSEASLRGGVAAGADAPQERGSVQGGRVAGARRRSATADGGGRPRASL